MLAASRGWPQLALPSIFFEYTDTFIAIFSTATRAASSSRFQPRLRCRRSGWPLHVFFHTPTPLIFGWFVADVSFRPDYAASIFFDDYAAASTPFIIAKSACFRRRLLIFADFSFLRRLRRRQIV
jgi:hypothetical protein